MSTLEVVKIITHAQKSIISIDADIVLNDKNRTIFNLKYCKGFHILVLGKRMEILYYFKPFDTKIIIRQVDYFLFLLAISSKYNFFHLFSYCGCEFGTDTVAPFLR